MAPEKEIQKLIDLISNVTEAHTTALFLAPEEGEDLTLYAWQSLSGNIIPQVRIGPGEGLIGWVYKFNKPVNVDKFDHDTRNLLFYSRDEDIKSFMAVPLQSRPGVLAVDSKKRYSFSEQSQKFLRQFCEALEQALALNNRAQSSRDLESVLSFVSELEMILSQERSKRSPLSRALGLIRAFSGSEACFLAAVYPGDTHQYYVAAHDSKVKLKISDDFFPIEQGLAGWVMQNRRLLALERSRQDLERTYLFYPDEPMKKHPKIFGFPVLFQTRLRGALLLAGEGDMGLDSIQSQALELAAYRLAAAMEIDLYVERLREMNGLEPQVGLPHRTNFINRLNRLLKMSSVKKTTMSLALFRISNLNEMAVESGQDAARDALKTVVQALLRYSHLDFELGHLDFGVIGMALTGYSEAEAIQTCDRIKNTLVDIPLGNDRGPIHFEIDITIVSYPKDAMQAETLVAIGMNKLSRPSRSNAV